MAKQNIRQSQQMGKNRDMEKDYDASDLKHVFAQTKMHSWKDAIDYLDKRGMNDNELTPGETMHMKQDLQQAQKQRIGFTDDASKAFKLVHGTGAKAAKAKR